MVRDGIYYALAFTSAGVLISVLADPYLGIPLFILGAFCAWFFRDPERLLPAGPVALSPADGKVVAVVQEQNRTTRISIFLNIFDVHVNRTPIGGTITDITYRKGKFLVASREDATAENEQNVITVVADDGTKVVFSQIAGLIARRIVCYKKVGDRVQTGERIGLIKFGSRVDVFFGPEWSIEVTPGMRVAAGASILARRAGEIVAPDALAASLLEPALVEEVVLCQT
jgi:phosphatidylserine decarboxylase